MEANRAEGGTAFQHGVISDMRETWQQLLGALAGHPVKRRGLAVLVCRQHFAWQCSAAAVRDGGGGRGAMAQFSRRSFSSHHFLAAATATAAAAAVAAAAMEAAAAAGRIRLK